MSDAGKFWRDNTRPGTWGRPRSMWQRFYDWIAAMTNTSEGGEHG